MRKKKLQEKMCFVLEKRGLGMGILAALSETGCAKYTLVINFLCSYSLSSTELYLLLE